MSAPTCCMPSRPRSNEPHSQRQRASYSSNALHLTRVRLVRRLWHRIAWRKQTGIDHGHSHPHTRRHRAQDTRRCSVHGVRCTVHVGHVRVCVSVSVRMRVSHGVRMHVRRRMHGRRHGERPRRRHRRRGCVHAFDLLVERFVEHVAMQMRG